MNKEMRNGVDVRVALSTGLKRQALLQGNSEAKLPASANISREANAGVGSVSRVQKLLSNVASAFGSLRFRRRRSAIKRAKKELKYEINRVSGVLLQEMREMNGALVARLDRVEQNSNIGRVSGALQQQIKEMNDTLSTRLDHIEQYSSAAARRIAINCGSEEVLVRSAVGFVFCSTKDCALLACLLDTGDLELGTRLLIQRFLKPGDTFVDVGANIGIHTLAAARAMQGRGRIIAFEPFGPTKQLLDKAIWINGFSNMVQVYQAAVLDVAGSHHLYLGKTSGHHSVFPLGADADADHSCVDIPSLRLDDVLSSADKVDLMKIDVEGAETEVIRSANSVLSNNPDVALIVEFGPAHLQRIGKTFAEWMENFVKLELSYKVINAYTGTLESWTDAEIMTVESVNLFFARENSRAWGKLQ